VDLALDHADKHSSPMALPSRSMAKSNEARLIEKVRLSRQRGTFVFDLQRRIGLDPPRRLTPKARKARGTTSSRRLNSLASLLVDPKSYLEVGVWAGATFQAVEMAQRIAVDPDPKFACTRLPAGVSVHRQTSDEFFERLDSDAKFDLILLDGLHTYEQTYRDLTNSLRHTRPRSFVLVDDVVPSDETSAIPDQMESYAERVRLNSDVRKWHGDVFRLVLVLRDHHPELAFRTIVGESDNEQAVIWRKLPDAPSPPIDEESLRGYRRYSYRSVFSKGVPDFFRPGTEGEVMQEVREFTIRHWRTP
jgi:predicted O-methyltransferase YrrM